MKTKNSTRKKTPVTIQPDSIRSTANDKPTEHTGIVRLSNMRTGRIVRMGAKAATLLSTKYPTEFKIL
jgi:hypothetical protein